ncbi:MAG: hypothetical protein AAGJ40_09255 [Planctomycetota bacterium]
MTHARAPWRVEKGAGHISSRIVSADVFQSQGPPEDDKSSAGRSYSSTVCEIPHDASLPEVAGNAALMEAAPELLVELEKALAFICRCVDWRGDDPPVEAIRAAIRRAKGNQ